MPEVSGQTNLKDSQSTNEDKAQVVVNQQTDPRISVAAKIYIPPIAMLQKQEHMELRMLRNPQINMESDNLSHNISLYYSISQLRQLSNNISSLASLSSEKLPK